MSRRSVCLLYHDVIAGTPPTVSGGSEHFAVSRTAFESQLDVLRRFGLVGRSIEEVATAPADNSVVISFDDGDAGQFEQALPALLERGMTATFFVTTAWIGTVGYVSWPQLLEMKAAGMSIQSHTRSHPFLSELDEAALRDELRTSKQELDERLEQNTTSLALPGGDMPRRGLRRVLSESGYRVVATSRWGTNSTAPKGDDTWFVRRCTVRGEPSLEQFQRIVRGDRLLAARRRLRDTALRTLRAGLGSTRYDRWRKRFLEFSAS